MRLEAACAEGATTPSAGPSCPQDSPGFARQEMVPEFENPTECLASPKYANANLALRGNQLWPWVLASRRHHHETSISSRHYHLRRHRQRDQTRHWTASVIYGQVHGPQYAVWLYPELALKEVPDSLAVSLTQAELCPDFGRVKPRLLRRSALR